MGEISRTIEIFLPDNQPDHHRIVEVPPFWTGKIFWFKNLLLPKLVENIELASCGIYVLIGSSENNPLLDRVYIGSSESVIDRLRQHDNNEEMDFWETTVVLVDKSKSLNSAHAKLLEGKIISTAREAGLCELVNVNTPKPILHPGQEAQVEYHFEQLRLVLPTLGINFLKGKPVAEAQRLTSPYANKYQIRIETRGVVAVATEDNGEFIVEAGSGASLDSTEKLPKTYIALREKLIQTGVLSKTVDKLAFVEDYSFSSPSAAACVVYGSSVSGPKQWINVTTGLSYEVTRRNQLGLAT